MRLLSLLVTLLIVGWLAYTRLGREPAAPEPSYRKAEQQAITVDAQVQDQFADQAGQLSRMEEGGVAESP